MVRVIDILRNGHPERLEELAQVGKILWRSHNGVLAYFDIGAPNGLVEAVNGRLAHMRGIALGSGTWTTTFCGRQSTPGSFKTGSTHCESQKADNAAPWIP